MGLEFDFSVRTDDPASGRYLDKVFRPLAATGRPAHAYFLALRGHARRASLRLDDALLYENSDARTVVAHLLWHVNRQVVKSSTGRYHLLHAAAGSHGSTGVLFPGPAEAGKTTLIAALVAAGLGYLTDEAAPVDPASLQIHPFPKALTLESGSWPLFSHLRPVMEHGAGSYVATQWHVDPDALRAGAVAGPCQPRAVIAPSYRRGASTELRPLSAADATIRLAENSFSLSTDPHRALDVCARIARGSYCWELEIGDLNVACDLVLKVLSDVTD